MFSVAYIFRRPAGMSIDEFHVHYRDVHAPLAAKLPGLVGYIQCSVRADAPPVWMVETAAPFDALSIYTFASDEAAKAAFAAPENELLQRDTAIMIEFTSMITLPLDVREVV